jgi:serine phosphatase RsbU (regulator of sigma subunit)
MRLFKQKIFLPLLFLLIISNLNDISAQETQQKRAELAVKITKLTNDSIKAYWLYELAEIDFQLKNYSDCRKSAQNCHQIASANDLSKLKGKSLWMWAKADAAEENNAEAIQNYIRTITIYEKASDTKALIQLYQEMAAVYENYKAHEKGAEYREKAINLLEKAENEKHLAANYDKAGDDYQHAKKYNLALSRFTNLLLYSKKHSDKHLSINVLHKLANVNKLMGEYYNALDNYLEIKELSEELADKKSLATAYNNIGYINTYLQEYNAANVSFGSALKLDEELKASPAEISTTLINIGICNQNLGNYNQAIKNLGKALKIQTDIGNKAEMAKINNILAIVYSEKGDYSSAELQSKESVENAGKAKAWETLQQSYKTYSQILQDANEYEKALIYYQKYLNLRDSLMVAERMKELDFSQRKFTAEKSEKEVKLMVADAENRDLALKQLLLEREKSQKENELQKRDLALKEAALREKEQMILLVQQHHQAELKQKEVEKLQNEKELQSLHLKQNELEKKEKQKTIDLLQTQEKAQKAELEKKAADEAHFKRMAGLFFIIFALILFAMLNSVRANNKLKKQKIEIQQKNVDLEQKTEEILAQKEFLEIANIEIQQKNTDLQQKSEEIMSQNEQIMKQSAVIEKKNEAITSSINYASRIQTAVLPPLDFLTTCLGNNFFVIYKPRDIVSGDFYWIKKIDHFLFLAAADCTGHGVPGAFMSMLGISFLNEIVNSNYGHYETAIENNEPEKAKEFLHANLVLNKLRDHVKESLWQRGIDNEAKDGMDIAFCTIDTENMTMQFSGANNPLLITRKTPDQDAYEIIELKPDKMPIGIYVDEKESFENSEVQLQENDTIYMFSDGYEDQFGGEKGRKFLIKNLKTLLLSVQGKPMKKQEEILLETLANWQGQREQVDDILFIGFQIPNTKNWHKKA